jgi:hypothetical protein
MKQFVSKRENMCCRRLHVLRPRTVTQCYMLAQLRIRNCAARKALFASLEAPDIQISLLGILSRCAGGRPRQFLEITHCGLCRARVAL